MKTLKRIGLAGLAAAVLAAGAIGAAPPDGEWAVAVAIAYNDSATTGEQVFYQITTTTICTGYGFAASLAFGPLGALGFGASCTIITTA